MNKYVVGLCGTHGTGKSTILQMVKDDGYPVDESQLSRAAQTALGWESLSKAQESVENMWALQDTILQAMYDRDTRIEQSGITTLVDRTPADVWAYTAMWCDRLGVQVYADTKARHFRAQCYMAAERYARFLIVPDSDKIPFKAEANRADLESRAFVDREIRQFIFQSVALEFYEIKSTDREHRAVEAAAWMVIHSEKLHDKTDNT